MKPCLIIDNNGNEIFDGDLIISCKGEVYKVMSDDGGLCHSLTKKGNWGKLYDLVCGDGLVKVKN